VATCGVSPPGALTDNPGGDVACSRGCRIRPHADPCGRGLLDGVAVEGAAGVLIPGSSPAPRSPLLLSPFDNLLWDRPLLVRAFGFRHVIEVYKRAPSGCTATILPSVGDRFADGRTEARRPAGRCLKIFHPEPDRRAGATGGLERASALARCIGPEVESPCSSCLNALGRGQHPDLTWNSTTTGDTRLGNGVAEWVSWIASRPHNPQTDLLRRAMGRSRWMECP